MSRTRIKICGITRVEDARAAALAGADAIGMVFLPGAPRNVSIATAQQILAVLPPFLTPVALFVNAPIDQILETTRTLRLRHVQLHGQETPTLVGQLQNFRVLKSIRVNPNTFADELRTWRKAIVDQKLTNLAGLILETDSDKGPGGTGMANDWTTIKRHIDAGDFEGLPPVIAAGGLNPRNVAEVMGQIHPFAVDVSSGVEETMAQKSPQLIKAFIRAVQSADLRAHP